MKSSTQPEGKNGLLIEEHQGKRKRVSHKKRKNIEARRKWNNAFQVLKKVNCLL